MALDVTRPEDMQRIVARAQAKHGRIDVLIKNAGVMPLSPLASLKVEEWNRMLDVNVRGVLHGIAAVLPIMQEQDYGHIINIAPTGAYTVSPTAAVYCASKFAVRAISDGLRQETDTIRVTLVSPGVVESELADHITDETARAAMREFRRIALPPEPVVQAIQAWISANSSSVLRPVLINRKHGFIYPGVFMSESGSFSRAMPFAGRVAIVTGAASGVGLATVELLHSQGARIVAVGRGDNVNALAREGIVPVVADVAQEASAELAVRAATEQFSRLDILINNAGIIINQPVAEMTLREWNQVMAVNATGAFLFSREAMRPMMAAKSGAIVNIGSYACYQSFPGIAAYAASKGALAQLTRTLALEAIAHGIRVNAVGSGDAVTNITNTIQPDGQAYLAEHGRKAPVGRAAHPDEIAEVAAFLASDRASYIVGAVVMADGGMSVAIQ